MILTILGILILVKPIAYIPQLFKNKEKTGFYFSADKSVVTASSTRVGPEWNVRSKGGYLFNLVVGLFFLVYGLYSWLN